MLEIILIMLSFGSGVAVFLYLLSLYNQMKDKKQHPMIKKDNAKPVESIKNEPAAINTVSAHLKQRTCPLCKSTLTRYEALYATKLVKNNPTIFIYGCRYCFKPEEDPHKIKKSDI